MKKQNVIHLSGQRKKAIARATLTEGKGKVKINGTLLDNYSTSMLRMRIKEPLILAEDLAKTKNINVKVNGGGVNGQADAARLAIARVLVEQDPKLKKVFYDYDRLLLVADVRENEECKPNDSKPRKKRQKSYR